MIIPPDKQVEIIKWLSNGQQNVAHQEVFTCCNVANTVTLLGLDYVEGADILFFVSTERLAKIWNVSANGVHKKMRKLELSGLIAYDHVRPDRVSGYCIFSIGPFLL